MEWVENVSGVLLWERMGKGMHGWAWDELHNRGRRFQSMLFRGAIAWLLSHSTTGDILESTPRDGI
jgi:hypothetical protein